MITNIDDGTTVTTCARDERGMSTAEYAVGTIGAVCIGCIVLRLADDASWIDTIFDQLRTLFAKIQLTDVRWRPFI